jgi:hypothetical protein
LSDSQVIDPVCYDVLYRGGLVSPCGLYVEPVKLAEQWNQFQFSPLSDDAGRRMVGFRMTYLSFALVLLFDPEANYGANTTAGHSYRPSYLIAGNVKRTQTVMLTWPATISTERRIVQVTF